MVGYMVAADGASLRDGQTFADPLDSIADRTSGKRHTMSEMLDATTFLTEGGQKGPQTSVLPPGTYRLNPFLWNVNVASMKVTEVPAGSVAVVKSNDYAGQPGRRAGRRLRAHAEAFA